MTTAIEAYLTLGQWLSPSYPVGAFAYSHGLETAIAQGAVTDAETLLAWLSDLLRFGAGQNDALFLYAAYRSERPEQLAETDAMARAFAASAERLHETVQQGAAFARTTQAVWGHDLPQLTYPVAVGRAARLSDLPGTLTVAAFLHAFAANLASVAMRAIPLGQTDGQKVMHALKPLARTIALETAGQTLDDLSSIAFLSDIAAMRHETQTVRIFRT